MFFCLDQSTCGGQYPTQSKNRIEKSRVGNAETRDRRTLYGVGEK